MKKKLLSTLLFLSIFIAGCSGTDLFSTNNSQTSQPTTNDESKQVEQVKKSEPEHNSEATTNKTDEASEQSDKTNEKPASEEHKEPQSAPEGEKGSKEDPNAASGEKKSGTQNNPASEEHKEPQSAPEGEKGSKEDPNAASDEKKSGTQGNPSTEEHKEQPEPKHIVDDTIMIGIIVALVIVILILAWLVYDRHKMKNKLNNLSNYPPNPNTPTQNIDNPSQNSTPTAPTNLIPSPVHEQLTIRVDNLRHIGARKEQQDHFCVSDTGNKKAILEKGFMAVVADGMGGLEGGALISRLVTDTFLDNYKNQFNFEPASFLYHTAESAEFAVENYIKQTGINGGSTLVAVMIKDSQMNYVSVGDSHIYLLRDNILTLKNKEHSFGALLREKADRGEIDPREPDINPKRNSLTAYIGMGSFKIVDRNTQPIILKGGDKVLLCSDGVYNALGDDALIAALAGDASTAARKIQSDILAQNIPSQDNFTAVIIECVST